ncbi:hypothetical protein BDV38DRAFT_271326 [Aspergillus pseudotamarii]|uniref:NAD(P)-binding protein n=1 Tax=Aspergillus pseudotamarii TaxID=132259 RepID=A0A5N6SUL8_ASPPS|nr:uncharacterized protein BDV38DRAFT_271326 [Aspergillus pseudotamarii]KAE8137481.1 hypothetical protein BDV38DRAFT_271326 [Aspergillus pseudotamarii]
MPSSPKTILITGGSAHGIGATLGLELARQGHYIFATAHSITKVPESLTSLANVQVLSLDVTDPTSISDAARVVRGHSHGLHILVNNAGIGYTMPLLDADLDRAKQVYEANVGRIVNISSVGAVVNTPWIGIYSSSKAAVTQLSETLRLELAPLGVAVVCLMAGTITTAFHANEPEVTISDWGTGRVGPKGCSADEFAASIVDDVLGSTSRLVWKGPYSPAVRFLSHWCPLWLLDRMMSSGQGLDELAPNRGQA